MAFSKTQLEPTVVHRAQYKTTRPVIISPEQENSEKASLQNSPISSPSTSAGTSGSNSGKSSTPGVCQSTPKTSLDSKFSKGGPSASQHSSENKRIPSKQVTTEGGSNEKVLSSIAELENTDPPVLCPSKLTQIITIRSGN